MQLESSEKITGLKIFQEHRVKIFCPINFNSSCEKFKASKFKTNRLA